MIERLESIVSQHADALAQDDPVTPAAVPKQYLQNTTTAAVHALRPQNLAQTICGWTYGVTSKRGRVRRSGNYERIPDLEGIPGPMICKNCMPSQIFPVIKYTCWAVEKYDTVRGRFVKYPASV